MRHGYVAVNDNGRQLSRSLFGKFDDAALLTDRGAGFVFFDDFHRFPNKAVGASATDLSGEFAGVSYWLSGDATAGASWAQSATVPGGVVAFTGGTADNESAAVQWDGAGVLLAATSIRRLGFEARFKASSITSGMNFIGLLDVATIAEDVPILDNGSDSAPVSDNNLIGFFRSDADEGNLNVVYKADGQTVQIPSGLLDYATLVADTFVKVGFLIDFTADASKRVKFFKNGVENTTTYLTGANLTATTFPSDAVLCPTFAHKNTQASATAITGSLDWVAMMVEYA